MKFENQTDTAGIEVTEWKWDFGDGTFFYDKDPPHHGYLSTGMYTVQLSVTCSNGCSDNRSKAVQVCRGMLKKPMLFAYGPAVWYLVCSNDTARYYRWYYNDDIIPVAVSYIYVANQALGEYSVAISNDDTCYVASDVISVPPIAQSTYFPEGEIMIYPNPNDGRFYVSNLFPAGKGLRYRLSDSYGNEISEDRLPIRTNEVLEFNFSLLKEGIYFIGIFSDESGIYTGKIVIEK